MRVKVLITVFSLLVVGCNSVPEEHVEQDNVEDSVVVEEVLDSGNDAEESGESEVEIQLEENKVSVLDYYKMIPDEFFWDLPLEDRMPGEGDVVDEENYYIEVMPRDWDGEVAMTVFLHQGEPLIATSVMGCGPMCEQRLSFFEYENGELRDVSATVLPDYNLFGLEKRYMEENDIFNVLLVLPRYGTTIEIVEQFTGDVLMKLHWRNGKFEVEAVEV